MSEKVTPKPGIEEIKPYVGGKATLTGFSNAVKLSSNENPYGASPKAQEAFVKEASRLAVYPSSDHTELREAIANVHGLDADRILIGNGSDELIAFLCQAYAGEGDEVLFTEHGFSMYRISALANGATPVAAPENERVTDVDALLDAVTENTRLLFLANPNNPTGTMIATDEVARLAEGLPKNCLLVLDAAYAEYVDGFDGGASLVEAHENVVMTRTFSKIYGLGGLRLGWMYAGAGVIDIIHRIRGPFNVNSPALTAGLAAVEDQDYVAQCRVANTKSRDWLAGELNAIGLPSDPSAGNFILVRFASEEAADAADKALQDNGLLVRGVKSYGLPNCLRITIGKPDDCKSILRVLDAFQKGAA